MTINKHLRLLALLIVSSMPATVTAKECISVVLSGSISRSFWSQVAKGAIVAGNQLGYDIHVRGTINDDDSLGQTHILNLFDQRYHCKGIVIAPANKDINLLISKLKIPTIYIDRDTGGDRAATVKTDNYAAGKLAAQEMSKTLGGQGNVVLFRLQKGVVSTDARESGFIDEAKKMGLKIIAAPYIGTRVGEARDDVLATLKALDHIDGIFTPNDTTTIGTLIIRSSMNKHKNVIHIGFDETPVIIKNLNNNMLTGYITQSPYQMGYQGVYSADKAIHGELDTENIATPVNYITK